MIYYRRTKSPGQYYGIVLTPNHHPPLYSQAHHHKRSCKPHKCSPSCCSPSCRPKDCVAAMEDLESRHVGEINQYMVIECRSNSLCLCHPRTSPQMTPAVITTPPTTARKVQNPFFHLPYHYRTCPSVHGLL